MRTELIDVGIFSKSYNGSGTTFGRLDRFNRTLISSWTRDLATNRDIYKVTLGYDRNSNITSQDDAVHTGHDVAYANDDLNRLIDADEGTLSSGSIGTRTRRQQWTLNQAGNWNRDKVDLNGDADYLDAGELDDTRTHNSVNELLTRDTNTSSPAEFSLTYDAAGNMTDDGVYKYEWDAFYRLRKVKNQSNALVSEYWYNGLGYLVTRHQDTDVDGDVDGSDLKFHTAYDERWRQVATFRGSDANPKERFLYHWAGDGGFGDASYIDSVVLRDRDMTNGWTGAADGTLEERVYYLQNWRADVVGLVEPDNDGGATMVEWVKYSAYGVPFALPAGDTDSDGDCDSTDDAHVTTWKDAPFYDVRGDLDLDGVVDAADETLVVGAHQALGRGVLTSTSIGNRKGYAGYEGDAKLSAKWYVRHRVLDSVMGRWLSRDPLEYSDGMGLHRYCTSQPIRTTDPRGLSAQKPVPFPSGVVGATLTRNVLDEIEGKCGLHESKHQFQLSGTPNSICGLGQAVYVIQEIKVDDSATPCPDPEIHVRYWEAFVISTLETKTGVDSWRWIPDRKRQGYRRGRGEARWTCSGTGGVPAEVNSWPYNPGAGPYPAHPWAPSQPVTTTQPSFWSAFWMQREVRPFERDILYSRDCCPAKQDSDIPPQPPHFPPEDDQDAQSRHSGWPLTHPY